MANDIAQIITSIAEKAKRLKEKATRLEKENKEYRETVFKHLSTIGDLQNQIKTLEATSNGSKVATLTNKDVVQLKKEIDKYVRVIDKAMAQLQK
ncbi:MAG: hypothetical protein RLZZ118_747 [Bacteroidota bacterium]|jgi:phage host-nuclease inhibitor protein Gam